MFELAARLLDPMALLLVLGGTALSSAMRGTREDLARALAALRPLLRARPAADAMAARRSVREIEHIVSLRLPEEELEDPFIHLLMEFLGF